jgi:glycine/serine hydroxymethyltransferase
MDAIAAAIARMLESGDDAAAAAEVKRSVADLCAAFPLV